MIIFSRFKSEVSNDDHFSENVFGMKLFKTICALSCIDANLYTGKSYEQNGHIRFQISSAKEAKALQKIENEFQIEWLAPHEGTMTTVF